MSPLHPRVLFSLFTLAAFAVPTIAQTTVPYANNDNNASDYNTTSNKLTLTIASGSATQSGVISGSGSVDKTGAGTLIVTAANTHTGGTTVSAGTLQLGNGGSTGSITGNIANSGTVISKRSDDYTFDGVISGSGGFTNDGNNIRFAQAQTYTGPTVINNNVLVLSTTQDQGLSASTVVTVATSASLDISSRTTEIAGLNGNGYVYSFIPQNPGVGILTINTAGASTSTFSGNLGYDVNNQFSLVKTGTGTQILSGSNSYTGTTSVNAGTLLVNGANGASVVTVADGATLGGSGSFTGLTTIQSGAHLAPGNSPGTLTFSGGLTLNTGSILDFELGTSRDLIAVTGGILTGPSGTGGVILNLSNSGGFAAGTYTLFDFTTGGTTTSDFEATDFALGSTISGFTYSLALSGNSLQLTASAIPEPSTYAALAGLAALGLAFYRKRVRSA
jgi:fibronectin-binding autotransporter adhesin